MDFSGVRELKAFSILGRNSGKRNWHSWRNRLISVSILCFSFSRVMTTFLRAEKRFLFIGLDVLLAMEANSEGTRHPLLFLQHCSTTRATAYMTTLYWFGGDGRGDESDRKDSSTETRRGWDPPPLIYVLYSVQKRENNLGQRQFGSNTFWAH